MLIGCGGHARSILHVIREVNDAVEIVLVDESAKDGELILGCRVQKLYRITDKDKYIVAIGNNQIRRNLFMCLKEAGRGKPISIFSLNSRISDSALIGNGTFIAPGACVGAQACIGDNTVINTASVIEHEAVIGRHVHISPNTTICGRTKIGNNVFCGAGSVIIDKTSVCDNVIIGAGTVVKDDITIAGTYVGVPARKVK